MTEAHSAKRGERRWVVKIGSALLTGADAGLRLDAIADWVRQMAALWERDYRFVVVSSGAVAEGAARLGWRRRPATLHGQQAAAAVGQTGLVQAYESAFQKHGARTAQILLTHDDVAARERYLNARSTLRTLLALGVAPIVNENDSVATDEIRFGDNDSLAGLVANLVEAERLIILTDQAGLHERDPRLHPGAPLIKTGRAGDAALKDFARAGGGLGRGGMLTKLEAAAVAAQSGADTLICSGLETDALLRLAAGEQLGTLLRAGQSPLAARKQWLGGHKRLRGELTIDAGACRVLTQQGKSLLAVGVVAVSGQFHRGEVVRCVDERGREIARGLVNYGAAETRALMGRPSGDIESLLGYAGEPELIHRDNMALFPGGPEGEGE